MDGAAGHDDRFTFDDDAVARFGAGFDAGGGALHANTFRAGIYNKPCAVALGVAEPGLGGGLLGADGTAIAAIATQAALFEANDVARHCVHMPAKVSEAAFEDLLAAGHAVVVLIDAQPLADSIETAGVFFAADPAGAGFGPFFADVVRCTEGRGVIHHGAAAQAFAGKHANAVIAGGSEAAFGVKALEALQLGAVKVGIVVVAAGFENNHFFAGGG